MPAPSSPVAPLRRHRLAPVALLALLALGALPLRADEAPPAPPRTEAEFRDAVAQLHPGMPAADVRRLLGEPLRVSRQILYGRYLEQWTYDSLVPLRVEFAWRKGEERHILTVQPLSTPPK